MSSERNSSKIWTDLLWWWSCCIVDSLFRLFYFSVVTTWIEQRVQYSNNSSIQLSSSDTFTSFNGSAGLSNQKSKEWLRVCLWDWMTHSLKLSNVLHYSTYLCKIQWWWGFRYRLCLFPHLDVIAHVNIDDVDVMLSSFILGSGCRGIWWFTF